MTESEFQRLADATLLRLEEAVDASGADVDTENAGGILTLRFDDGSQIIINRQTPAREIWVAARSGGFHFGYDAEGDRWLRTGDRRELAAVLTELAAAQGAPELVFEL